jgi:hypothetical protein
MSSLRAIPLLLLALLTPACASNPPASTKEAPADKAPPAGAATVVVDNPSAFDMDIYVIRRDGPVRVGFAPAKEKTRFTLAPGVLAGSGTIQFSAKPTRGGETVISDVFAVQAGDELTWTIPA